MAVVEPSCTRQMPAKVKRVQTSIIHVIKIRQELVHNEFDALHVLDNQPLLLMDSSTSGPSQSVHSAGIIGAHAITLAGEGSAGKRTEIDLRGFPPAVAIVIETIGACLRTDIELVLDQRFQSSPSKLWMGT